MLRHVPAGQVQISDLTSSPQAVLTASPSLISSCCKIKKVSADEEACAGNFTHTSAHDMSWCATTVELLKIYSNIQRLSCKLKNKNWFKNLTAFLFSLNQKVHLLLCHLPGLNPFPFLSLHNPSPVLKSDGMDWVLNLLQLTTDILHHIVSIRKLENHYFWERTWWLFTPL